MKITRKQLRKLIKETTEPAVFSREFYTPEKFKGFRPVSNEGRIHVKPAGLWYSCNEEWKNWVMYEMPQWWESYNFKYNINVDLSKMLVIRTEEEFLAFEKEYVFGNKLKAIDWERVANRYAGIEICPYQYRMRGGHKWYRPWDIGSGCIWDPSAFVSVEEVYPFR